MVSSHRSCYDRCTRLNLHDAIAEKVDRSGHEFALLEDNVFAVGQCLVDTGRVHAFAVTLGAEFSYVALAACCCWHWGRLCRDEHKGEDDEACTPSLCTRSK